MLFAICRAWTLFEMVQYHCNYSFWNPKIVRKHPADRWECSMPKSLLFSWSNISRHRLIWRKKTLDNPGWSGDVQLFKSMACDVLIIVFPSSYIVRDILCHIRYCTLGMVWCAWYGCPDRSNPLYIIRYIIYYIWYCALGKVWCAWYRMTQSSQKSRQSLFIGSCVIWQRDEAAEKF